MSNAGNGNLINFDIKIDDKNNPFTQAKLGLILKNFETHVGILDSSKYAMTPKYGQFVTAKKNPGDEPFDHPVIKGKRSKTTLKKLAEVLDKKYGIFSRPKKFEKSGRLQKAYEYLISFIFNYDYIRNKPHLEVMKKRWQTEVAAAMRMTISERMYEHNSNITRTKKGFDHVMVATGTFFKNIKAKIIKG